MMYVRAIVSFTVPGSGVVRSYGDYDDVEEACAWCKANSKYMPALYLYHDYKKPLPVSDVEF